MVDSTLFLLVVLAQLTLMRRMPQITAGRSKAESLISESFWSESKELAQEIVTGR